MDKIYFFFRDDDVGETGLEEKAFVNFLLPFLYHNIPVNLAVIPFKLEPSKIKAIINLCPDLFEIHMHGFYHIEHEPWSEFPEKYDIEIFKQNLIKADKLLRQNFNKHYVRIFTPPWHNIDIKFFPVLEKIKFKGISSSFNIALPDGLRNYSTALIAGTAVGGGGRFKTAQELIDDFYKNRYRKKQQIINNGNQFIGLSTHHKFYYQPEGVEILKEFITFLKNLGVGFCKMSEIHKGVK